LKVLIDNAMSATAVVSAAAAAAAAAVNIHFVKG